MLRRQVAFYMLKRPEVFFDYVQYFLEEDEESYESYVTNIFRGDSWGDTTVAAAIGRMFNLTVTIVTPSFYKAQHMMHDVTNDPHIVILANGGDPASQMPCSHFSATEKTEGVPVLPGIGLKHEKLIPKVLNLEEMKTLSDKWAVHQAKTTAITKYKSLTKGLSKVEKELAKLNEKVEKMQIHRKNIGKKLEKLTGEVLDTENQAASLNPTMSTQTEEQVAEQVSEESSGFRNVIQSLNISPDAQERVLRHISSRKRTYSEMNQPSEQLPSISMVTLNEILGESNPIQSHASQVIVQQPLPSSALPQTSQLPLSVIPQTSQEPHITPIVIHDTSPPPLPSMIQTIPSVHQRPITSTVSSLQQQQQQQQQQPQQVSGNIIREIRHSRSRAQSESIPQDQRLPNRFYCENCPRSYTRRSDLNQHVKLQCGKKEIVNFRCLVCNEGYNSKNDMHEHKARKHDCNPPYECFVCHLLFYSGATFSLHKKLKHPGVRFPKHKWSDDEEEDDDAEEEENT